MKIKARVLTWENQKSTVHEVMITERALEILAEQIAQERYRGMHFECIRLELDLSVEVSQ